ncbi:MAG: hypothetical protein JSW50_13115, partial [Candidatus Latescibacterota bacterium]
CGAWLTEQIRVSLKRGWARHAARLRIARSSIEPETGLGAAFSGRPGGVFPEEIARLSYPLHPGAVYPVRTEPFGVDAAVDGIEVLDLPAGRFHGYRIRIISELLDPDDQVVLWYGRCGELGSLIHLETIAMDVETGEMVRIISTETSWLSGLALTDPGRCRTRIE